MLSRKLLFAFIFFVGFKANAQSEQIKNLDSLAGQFIKYIRSTNGEKAFVITDKEFYVAGEKILLKALCFDSTSNKITYKSKNLFIDLVNNSDSVISQLLLNNGDGKTAGSILLPGTLKEGYFWIRAYTTNILKEDTNNIFVKPIYILNPNNPDSFLLSTNLTKPVDNTTDTAAPQLIFFPEGGSIISGTTATVAFRCFTTAGKPLNISGYVIDNRNNTVSKFKTRVPGIGKFTFNAFNPRKYFVHINRNNKELIYPLPGINQYACQLSLISQTDDVFNMRVLLGDSLYKKNKITYILGVSRDSLCFAANGTGMYDVTIPKNVFPRGKAMLFLFNDQNHMVSQRSIYINDITEQVSITTDKTNYRSREKVKLDIKISRADDLPVTALFSIAVIDDRFAEPDGEQNQLSDFITNDSALSEIEIMNQKKYSPEEMDLVRLLQRNIYPKWKYTNDVNFIPTNSRYADSNYSEIRGTVLNKKDEPLKNYIVNLFSEDKRIFRTDTTIDNGHFLFSLPDLDDGTQFNLKLTNLRGQGLEGKVILDKFDFPQFKTPIQLKKGFDQEELSVIQNFKIHSPDTLNYPNEKGVLKSVTIKGAKPKIVNYDESKRVSVFSDIITSDKFNKGDRNAIVNAISNVPGFNTGPNTLHLGSAGLSTGVPPLLVLDGVIISPSGGLKNFLLEYEQNSIDFIEILKGPQTAIYGIQGAGGVILINSTNKRKEVANINNKGFTTIFSKGYFKQTDFIYPDYDKAEIKNSSYPDLRSTIYWNGNIITDKQDTTLYFFTGDIKTNYTITITGITANGDVLFKKVKLNKM
jgi:hypothetical protein